MNATLEWNRALREQMNNTYDVAIVGSGLAGVCAALKFAKENKSSKVVLFDLGRPPAKRRHQIVGWFGVLPNSDGKLYMRDIQDAASLIGTRKAKSNFNWFNNILSNVVDTKIYKDRELYVGLEKRIKKNGFDYYLNDYIQLYPKEIHQLSRLMAESIESTGNVTFSFDNEVTNIHKQKGMFSLTTTEGDFSAKKVLLCVGRNGWRWVSDIFKSFGIVENNDIATFGIHAEISASYMKEFNKSHCTIRKEGLEVGPFSWNGTIIPEDHVDMAISAFRSNENRWKSDKVSFKIIGHRKFENNGVEQMDRLGKLTFLLANDRISKEKVSVIMNKRSKISIIPEYDWLVETCEDIAKIIPEFTTKAYFHVPTLLPMASKVKLGNNLETEVDNMFLAGESSGVHGLLAAAILGATAAEGMFK